VLVHEILAEDMVGERVALFVVVIVGHSRRAPRCIPPVALPVVIACCRCEVRMSRKAGVSPSVVGAGEGGVVAARGVSGKPPSQPGPRPPRSGVIVR
jgi:hypothetical protein